MVGGESGDTCLPQPNRFTGLVDGPGYDVDTFVFSPPYHGRVIQSDFVTQVEDGNPIGQRE